MHPRKFIRDTFGFAFAQYLVRATLMIRTLVAARLLGPQPLGAWNALQILMDNGNLAVFGTQQGLDQMVPPRIVGGDAAALRRVKLAALFNIVGATLIYCAGCLAWTHLGSSRVLASWNGPGVVLALFCVATTNIAYYQTSIMRSHGDFGTISGWMMLQGAIGGVLGLALTPRFGAWGLLYGWSAGCLVAFVFSTVRSRREAPMIPAPATEGLDLVQIGFPMFVFTASTQIMRQLDRLIILRFLGTEQLGLYSLAVMALTLLLYLPDAVTYVLYPQLLRVFGENAQDPESIRPRVERVLQASSVLVPALAGVAFLFARPTALLLLPKFLPGVAPLRALCFGAMGLAFGNFASIVLMTVGRQTMLIPAALVATAIGAALDWVAVRLGFGITGVAWATLITYALNGALLLSMAFAGLGIAVPRAMGLLARLYAPMVIALGIGLSLERFLPWAASPSPGLHVLRLGVATVLFSALYVMLVKPLTHGMGLRLVLAELHLPVVGPLLKRFTNGTTPREPQ